MIDLKDSEERLPPVHVGEVIEGIKIIGDGNQGHGVAKTEGYVIFVAGTRKGDRVNVKIISVRDNFAHGEVIK